MQKRQTTLYFDNPGILSYNTPYIDSAFWYLITLQSYKTVRSEEKQIQFCKKCLPCPKDSTWKKCVEKKQDSHDVDISIHLK